MQTVIELGETACRSHNLASGTTESGDDGVKPAPDDHQRSDRNAPSKTSC